jgi:type I restriction enzyme S subunit
MTKQGTKTAVPRLRFPEFRKANSWPDGALGDYATVVAGQSPEGAYYNETGEGLPFYQGKSDFGEIFLERPRKWTSQVTKRAGAGDIVMSVRAPVGALNVTTEDICIGRGLAAIQAKGSKWFLYYLLNSVSSSIIGNGGSVFDSINKDQIEKLRLFAPRDAAEQQKIADCLTSLDEVIAAQGRKVEALKAHKRGLMQQLFPREGETRPSLRFPEFRDAPDWELKRLDAISPSIFDGTHQTPTYANEGIPFFSVENLISGNANKYISREDYLLATKKNKPALGDVLITRIGKVGHSKVVDWGHEFSVYVTLAVIKRSPQVNSHFLHYAIQSELSQAEIQSKTLHNAVPPKINMDSLRAIQVFMAQPAEQQRIADCLSSLDTQIAAESRQLVALKTHKQGLMQQLFPVAESVAA